MVKIIHIFLASFFLLSSSNAQDLTPLPDGEITRFGPYSASLIAPTKRYAHAVLGDNIEAGGVKLNHNGKIYTYFLPETAVFEDRKARLVTLVNTQPLLILIVKSYINKGAALALYKIDNNELKPLAESEAIGMPNRWLNVVGVADFKKNGKKQIAAVVTPHLSGSLRLYELNDEQTKIVESARLDGYTNHIIGERDLDLVRIVNGKEIFIIIPTLNRLALSKIKFDGKNFQEVKQITMNQKIQKLISSNSNVTTIQFEDGTQKTINF